MTGGSGSGDDSSDVEPAWHERSSSLAGASIAALLVLGILFWGVSCVARQVNDPEPAPQYYLDPSTPGGRLSSPSASTATTETITSTSPPVTTDIDPGDTSTTSGTDTTPTSGTDTTPTSSTDTTTSFNPSNLPRTRTPSTYDDGRTRPRFNETRTAFPRP